MAVAFPAGAEAHQLSVSAAREEAAFYAESLVQRGPGTHFKVTSCRRHSAHAVSCGFKINGPRGYRVSGRVRTEHADGRSYDTISRAIVSRRR
jgi:hypothetical protein